MAYEFVRTSSQKIAYPHLAALDGAAKVAVSMWIWPANGAGTFDGYIGQLGAAGGGVGTDSGFYMNYEVSGDETNVGTTVKGGGSTGAFSASATLTPDAWNQLIMQYDGTEATVGARIRVYVGAIQRLSAATGSVPSTMGSNDRGLFLGVLDAFGLYWSGRLAEVAIWTGVVLDSSERTALAAGGLANVVRSSDLAFYAPLSANANDTIGPYTGTVTGATLVSHPPAVGSGGGGGSARNRVMCVI